MGLEYYREGAYRPRLGGNGLSSAIRIRTVQDVLDFCDRLWRRACKRSCWQREWGGGWGKYGAQVMLRVGGRTLLERAVEALKQAGISKLILVVGYQAANLKKSVAEHIQGIEIEYVENPDFATTNNIYSLWLAREQLAADDTILLESDLIFEPGLIRSLVQHPAPDLATVARYEQWMEGTVTLLDGKIASWNSWRKNFAFNQAGN